MTRLLRYLSPRAQTFWLNRWWAVLAAMVFAAFIPLYVYLVQPNPHQHAGFVTATVVSTMENASDSGYSASATVRLPDGTYARISAGTIAEAQAFVGTPCLEQRLRESGNVFYRLTAQRNCAD
ncbi:hypothetical protein [Sulfitobacter aestuariivivens]|uniref:Uncharacterized protein n=1 Tax=Sulfitobacter aestuariivivens TaxID=2766981 RepID=A0A927D155_9RHOB|nr:hypothetical protein [Sulfitobacter aestuariivivens]MBD3663140.1 hypothetical protein [Sulfitobacter aestuariivivens]